MYVLLYAKKLGMHKVTGLDLAAATDTSLDERIFQKNSKAS